MDEKPKATNDEDGQVDKARPLSEELRRKVFGQQEAVDEVLKSLTRKRKPSIIFTGPPGVGKTAIMEALAKSFNGSTGSGKTKITADGLAEAFASRKGSQPGGVIILDEIHKMDKEQLSEAFDRAFGLAAAAEIGEQAAQACHEGLAEGMPAMKVLRLKRGYAYLM